jgi:SAM-dependent methyltransferase
MQSHGEYVSTSYKRGEIVRSSMTDRMQTFGRILADLGSPIRPDAKLLDFGCGGGSMLASALSHGINAYGCDVDFACDGRETPGMQGLIDDKRMRPIDLKPYRLSFNDATFDVVVSDQVFEHVQNYREALAELWRVMKPGAVFLHIFPSRYTPVELHIFVPLASFFHPRWWFWFWATLGIRNEFQRELTVPETVDANEKFMREKTNYLSPDELVRYFSTGFRVTNAERQFMRISRRARLFLFPWLYRTFRQHCLYGVKV